jgi:hypothetical protein
MGQQGVINHAPTGAMGQQGVINHAPTGAMDGQGVINHAPTGAMDGQGVINHACERSDGPAGRDQSRLRAERWTGRA